MQPLNAEERENKKFDKKPTHFRRKFKSIANNKYDQLFARRGCFFSPVAGKTRFFACCKFERKKSTVIMDEHTNARKPAKENKQDMSKLNRARKVAVITHTELMCTIDLCFSVSKFASLFRCKLKSSWKMERNYSLAWAINDYDDVTNISRYQFFNLTHARRRTKIVARCWRFRK